MTHIASPFALSFWHKYLAGEAALAPAKAARGCKTPAGAASAGGAKC